MSAAVIGGDAAHLPLPDESVDSVVCDPPYALAELPVAKVSDALTAWLGGDRGYVPDGTGGFMGRSWDKFVPPPAAWDEAYRVLKPGGWLLAFAAPRTADLMGISIRLSGLTVRDSIMWITGTGFPKSRACLKPAHEPVLLARKPAPKVDPLPGLDACRVEAGTGDYDHRSNYLGRRRDETDWRFEARKVPPHDEGRWPPNILFGHGEGCEVTGTRRVPASDPRRADGTVNARIAGAGVYGGGVNLGSLNDARCYADADGMETVEAWDCAPGCPVAVLDAQSGVRTDTAHNRGKRHGVIYGGGAGPSGPDGVRGFTETGGASRFFPQFRYEAKAPASERPRLEDGTAWPTVKPVALMRWLVRLVTPPGGVVLDPFCGTGTTGEAAILESLNAVLIDKDPVAVALTRVRLSKPMQPDLFGLEAS